MNDDAELTVRPLPELRGTLEEQRDTVLAIAAQNADIASVLESAARMSPIIPVYALGYETYAFRFASGANTEARL